MTRHKNKILRNPSQKEILTKQRFSKYNNLDIYSQAISETSNLPLDELPTFRTKNFSHQKNFSAISLIGRKSYFLNKSKKDIYIINHLPILLRSGYKLLKKNTRNLIKRNLNLTSQ